MKLLKWIPFAGIASLPALYRKPDLSTPPGRRMDELFDFVEAALYQCICIAFSAGVIVGWCAKRFAG